MRFNKYYIFFIFFLFSCVQDIEKFKKVSKTKYEPYVSRGFALVYSDLIYEKNIVGEKLNNKYNYVLHSYLGKDTLIKIINPINSKSIVVKVKNNSHYPSIYNIVITKKMAENLILDKDNPYVEILTIKENDKFFAKKAKTFEEEKKVADKAPVDSVNITDLSVSQEISELKKRKSSYIINIADFYFFEYAESLKKRFIEEGNLTNIKIKKLSKNKFKVYSGPYDSFQSMKETYLGLNSFGFDNLDVIVKNK